MARIIKAGYGAYLTNTNPGHNKQFFVLVDNAGPKAEVCTAWGVIAKTLGGEKVYEGSKAGPFRDDSHAENYARAIVKSKIAGGYTLLWSTDIAAHKPAIAVEPTWFFFKHAMVTKLEAIEEAIKEPMLSKTAEKVEKEEPRVVHKPRFGIRRI